MFPVRTRTDYGVEACILAQCQIFLRRQHRDAFAFDNAHYNGRSELNQVRPGTPLSTRISPRSLVSLDWHDAMIYYLLLDNRGLVVSSAPLQFTVLARWTSSKKCLNDCALTTSNCICAAVLLYLHSKLKLNHFFFSDTSREWPLGARWYHWPVSGGPTARMSLVIHAAVNNVGVRCVSGRTN